MNAKVLNEIKQGNFRNLYLLHGTESYIIDDVIKKITTGVLREEEMEFNFSQYDLEYTPIENAIDDADTLGFMGDRKVILIKNPIFLTGQKSNTKIEHNLEKLEQYLKSPNPNSVVIFQAPYEKLDKRKKLTKLLMKEAGVIEAKSFNEQSAKKWVMQRTKELGVHITDNAIELLIQNVGANLLQLENEITKMEIYVGKGNSITEDIVNEMVAQTIEQNIFMLVDKVVNKKINDAYKILNDLLRRNEEPIKILALITRQFRIIFQTKILSLKGVSQSDIAKRLKLHPFAVKVAMNQSKHFSEGELKDILVKLAATDYNMKSGKDKILELDLFLTEIA